jgi:hypothetical protein
MKSSRCNKYNKVTYVGSSEHAQQRKLRATGLHSLHKNGRNVTSKQSVTPEFLLSWYLWKAELVNWNTILHNNTMKTRMISKITIFTYYISLCFSQLLKALLNTFHPSLTGLSTARTALIRLLGLQTLLPKIKTSLFTVDLSKFLIGDIFT